MQYGGCTKTAKLFDLSKGFSNVDTRTTTETPDPDLRRSAAEIVAAYVSANSVSAAQLPDVIRSVVDALTNLNGQAEAAKAEPQKPAVSIRKSVTPDYLICLEDGKKMKMLKWPLRTTYDMSPQDYREKWGLQADGGAELRCAPIRVRQADRVGPEDGREVRALERSFACLMTSEPCWRRAVIRVSSI